ncbi:MAG: DNA polymerase IV [Chloroflexi bacterium]|nr:DNA polymerase IV [Chloroflexota bacterium]
MPRTILHIDLDAFYCAVEELLNPDLRGKAFVVGGAPQERGVVSSASYPARKFGVHSAMPTSRALRLCPSATVVHPRHRLYSEYSEHVMNLLAEVSPLVEQISIDEAFLDVTGDPKPAVEVAAHLQARIRDELGLPSSLGVASNKLVAKIATNVGKAGAPSTRSGSEGPPFALMAVPPGDEAAFLAPLPVEMLWGVGPKTAERLMALGVRAIGELAAWPAHDLAREFGAHGEEMWRHARGIDDRPVVSDREAKQMSAETTFTRDIADVAVLRRTLLSLSEVVGRRLRAAQVTAITVKRKLRWPDFTTLTRQVTLERATDLDDEIYHTALGLFDSLWRNGKRVRLLGVAAAGLVPSARQLGLWEATGQARPEKLAEAVDRIRDKYGRQAIRRASLIDSDE